MTLAFDLEHFVKLTAQPVGTAFPLDGGAPRELARTPEDEARFQRYHATLEACADAAWFAAQFRTVAEWIEDERGPRFEVPKHRIRAGRWRVILCYAVDLLCELTLPLEEPPGPSDAAAVSRLTRTVERVLAGVEVDDGLEALRDARAGRRKREQGRGLHTFRHPRNAERDARWRQRSDELEAEGERSEHARARHIVEEERARKHYFTEANVRDVLRGRPRKRS